VLQPQQKARIGKPQFNLINCLHEVAQSEAELSGIEPFHEPAPRNRASMHRYEQLG
jgi:hypothetical protein